MKYVFMDVETTGFTSKDEVVQFSSLVTDSEFNLERVGNFYCLPSCRMHPDAEKVHHLSMDKLKKLSADKNGQPRFFEEQWLEEIKDYGDDVTFVSWSTGFFDTRLINQSLAAGNMEEFNFGEKTNTLVHKSGRYNCNFMKAVSQHITGSSRSLKLSVAIEKAGNEEECRTAFKNCVSKFKDLDGSSADYHSALYDAFCLWYLWYLFRDKLK